MTGSVPFKLYRPLALNASGDGVAAQTISATLTMVASDDQFQRIDGGVADRTVTLPVAAPELKGCFFVINNVGTTNSLLVKNVASTIATLNFGEQGMFGCTGAAWVVLMTTSSTATDIFTANGAYTGNNTHAGTETFSNTLTLADGSLVQRSGSGIGTGDLIEITGPDNTHGWATYSYEATVSPAAIETALFTVPAESVIVAVQANIATALTGGGTTVTASVGITGDVDMYGTFGAPTNVLTQNGKLNYAGSGNPPGAGAGLGVLQKATQALKLIGAATGGATAGDTALTGGTVKVKVIYKTLLPMVNQ